MKQIQQLLFLLLLLPFTGHSQTEATLLYHWEDNTLPVNGWLNLRYNETWGFALNGREYGVIGTTDGMRIFDLTDPSNVPAPIVVPGGATGVNIVHRDMKNMNGYLYAVCDEESASTLQIIDCNNLPNSAPVVYSSNEFVTTAHNVFIDTSQARLYLLGAGQNTKILDISNPIAPKLIAKYPNASLSLPYVHDAYIHNHIGFMNCGGAGLWVVDFSAPQKPVVLGTMTNYPGAGYDHSGWMCDDGRYYVLCDETHGSPVKLVDVSDYEDLHVVSSMNPESFSNQIPHNAIVRGNLVYVSYYYDGLQVFDISDPLQPKKYAYQDTYLGPNQAGFAGAWGVNPSLPSGTTLLSDLNNGFYVYAPITEPVDHQLRTNHPTLMICEGELAELQFTVGKDFLNVPMSINVDAPADAVIGLPTLVAPAAPFKVVLANLSLGEHVIRCNVGDGQHNGEALVHVFVKPKSAQPVLITPADASTGWGTTITFNWANIPGATNYNIEISTMGGAGFNQGIVYQAYRPTPSVQITGTVLQAGKTYFWRVSTANMCGPTYSTIFVFNTEPLSNTIELEGNKVDIYPNPVSDVATLQFAQAITEDVHIEIFDLGGQLLVAQTMNAGNLQTKLSMKQLPAGAYVLSLQQGSGAVRTTMLVKN